MTDGRILGHEGIGVIEQVGPAVTDFHVGDKVIISCVTACLKCDFCKRQMYSHCRHGGWILGYTLDGTHAEFARIPYADGSLYKFPADGDEEALVMVSDILPTGFECGVLNGQVKPGDRVAIVGAGPVGIAVLLTAQFYSPGEIDFLEGDKSQPQKQTAGTEKKQETPTGQESKPTAPAAPSGTESKPAAEAGASGGASGAGSQVYQTQGCASCHALGGSFVATIPSLQGYRWEVGASEARAPASGSAPNVRDPPWFCHRSRSSSGWQNWSFGISCSCF